ncbi:hypothetical protein E2562_025065 [Oryza meyeriana var. granulata]|uniref:RRM domain-containing protein n=1 Tax=Oryza meyeriana var. granulata TaxID=110450 RepID=A0A6G1D7J3_9ORYZ|nr:hypothetical protein E2562_025065 [Oryza meyeriana var. granulata]
MHLARMSNYAPYPQRCFLHQIKNSHFLTGGLSFSQAKVIMEFKLNVAPLIKLEHCRGHFLNPFAWRNSCSLRAFQYRKPLRPDGYLTDSQRHGWTGCSLTSLLMGLNTIRVIESCNLMDTGAGSNQIYMTFPVHSKFTEDDIENYFKRYGPVSGVRIPYQEKRMFGFVSFLYTETVRLILSKGTAHFICGARVLVKRYIEKPELRKISRKDKHFDCRGHRASGFNVTNEHHIGNNMKIISDKSDGLDEASTYEDSDEISLPDSLGLY